VAAWATWTSDQKFSVTNGEGAGRKVRPFFM
jgi:hypothetical protein